MRQDPHLQRLIEAWPYLSWPVRLRIFWMVFCATLPARWFAWVTRKG